MRFDGAPKQLDKTVVQYNPHVTVERTLLDACHYVANGKSAIEWIMDRYQITTQKDSRITNDPNGWSDHPRYMLDLLSKVIRVSMKTMEIVDTMPTLSESVS